MNFDIDLREVQRLVQPLADLPHRLRPALATALTRTAVAVGEAERREMLDSFDRPTRFTLGALFVQPATADTLQAVVGIKDQTSEGRPPMSWLRWQIFGGLRRLTGFERALVRAGAMDGGDRAVPGPYARLDGFGNVSRGQMAQILSQLRVETGRAGSVRTLPRFAAGESAANRARKRRSIVGAYRRAGGQFVALPYGRGKAPAGLYLVDRFNRRDLQPVLFYVSKAQYEQRFDFFGAARYAIQRELSPQVARAVGEAVGRLLVPGARVVR